jgi:hypothetical protein
MMAMTVGTILTPEVATMTTEGMMVMVGIVTTTGGDGFHFLGNPPKFTTAGDPSFQSLGPSAGRGFALVEHSGTKSSKERENRNHFSYII